MNLPDYFISCDWGTSNFRLKVVKTNPLNVLFEHKTNQGIKILFEKFLQQKSINQQSFFANYLKEQIQELPVEHQSHIIVAAGMSSSNIGLFELPYAEIPFIGNGENLIYESKYLENGLHILLISGVKTATGMMRGEEIQAVGLESYISHYDEGILLLPGTHCKHISYKQGNFIALKNYMTGELFEVLSQKSILSNSVESGAWQSFSIKAFEEGLKIGFKGKITSSLLSIRANHVFNLQNKTYNYFYLSGILIGDELSYLKQHKEMIFLAAPEPIFKLYKTALETIIPVKQLLFFDSKILEDALLIGQRKILQLYVK